MHATFCQRNYTHTHTLRLLFHMCEFTHIQETSMNTRKSLSASVSVWVKGHMYESCDTYMSHVTHTQYTIHNTQCSKEFVCSSESMSQGTHGWVMWHMTYTHTRKSLSAGVSLWVKDYMKEYVCGSESMSKVSLERVPWHVCLFCQQVWVYELRDTWKSL